MKPRRDEGHEDFSEVLRFFVVKNMLIEPSRFLRVRIVFQYSALALLARARVYGEKIEDSGPVLKAVRAEDNQLRLSFSHTTGGLRARNNEELTGFEIARADGVFAPATAKIAGSEITVLSANVAKPVTVRYGFAPNPAPEAKEKI